VTARRKITAVAKDSTAVHRLQLAPTSFSIFDFLQPPVRKCAIRLTISGRPNNLPCWGWSSHIHPTVTIGSEYTISWQWTTLLLFFNSGHLKKKKLSLPLSWMMPLSTRYKFRSFCRSKVNYLLVRPGGYSNGRTSPIRASNTNYVSGFVWKLLATVIHLALLQSHYLAWTCIEIDHSLKIPNLWICCYQLCGVRV
jgi:hypothetical protein